MADRYDDEARRQERRDAVADTQFEMWRSGLDPDRFDDDRCDANYYRGMDWCDAAMCEARRIAAADRSVRERDGEEADHG